MNSFPFHSSSSREIVSAGHSPAGSYCKTARFRLVRLLLQAVSNCLDYHNLIREEQSNFTFVPSSTYPSITVHIGKIWTSLLVQPDHWSNCLRYTSFFCGPCGPDGQLNTIGAKPSDAIVRQSWPWSLLRNERDATNVVLMHASLRFLYSGFLICCRLSSYATSLRYCTLLVRGTTTTHGVSAFPCNILIHSSVRLVLADTSRMYYSFSADSLRMCMTMRIVDA